MPTNNTRSHPLSAKSGPVVKPFKVKWPAATMLRQALERRPAFHAHDGSNASETDISHITLAPHACETCLVQDTTANPVPLGLIGLGMSILLLNLHFAGFLPIDAMILGMGTFCGGVEQIMVGIMAWKKNNIFAATAFTSYGLFWFSLIAMLISPATSSPAGMSAYMSIWAIFTGAIFLASFRHSKAIRTSFGLLLLFFILLAAGMVTTSPVVVHVAGYTGILSGISAIYTGLGQVINELFHRSLLPLGAQHL